MVPDQLRRARLELLADLGLNAVHVLDKNPDLMNRSNAEILERFENLNALGLKAVKVVNNSPGVLSFTTTKVREKLSNLTKLGLDAVRVANGAPTALNLDENTIRGKLKNLTALDLAAIEVVNGAPGVLMYSLVAVRQKMANLKFLGLHESCINKSPIALTLSVKSIQLRRNILGVAGSWQSTRDLLNEGEASWFWTTPVESLVLDAGTKPTEFRKSPSTAFFRVRKSGFISSALRKAELSRLLGHDGSPADEQFVANLGPIANVYLNYLGQPQLSAPRSVSPKVHQHSLTSIGFF